MAKRKVVILGGGFAGLAAANALQSRSDIELTLIDKSNHHLFQPLLYQVATAALSPARITYPLREIFRKNPEVTVLMGEVVHCDKTQQTVHLSDGESISYDILIIATGSRHSYFGNTKWQQFAPGLKTIQDAITIREKILTSFEIAERLGNSPEAIPYLNFVVIGGGPTGVEMAGAIADIAKTNLRENYRKVDPNTAKIFLIEALPHILPSYSHRLSLRAKKDLEKLGVTVLTQTKVSSIVEEGLYIEDTFLPTQNIIWAAGNEASPLLKSLGVPLGSQGRVCVEKDLSLSGYPNIFVIGDAAYVDGLPAMAAVAIQQGKFVAELIQKHPSLDDRPSFSYVDRGSMATIGRGKAVACIRNLEFTGICAWLLWGLLHLIYLVGFRNRIRVLFEWVVLFLTKRRGACLILGPLDAKIPKK